MTSATLETDVLEAQAGNRQAFMRLVDATRSLVCSICLATVRDVSLSEDVAQNVFVAAWQDLGKLRSPASFLPWLRQLARNKAKETIRARVRFRGRHAAWPDSGDLDVVDAHGDPASALIDQEEHLALAEAIEHLPDEAREVITLYYREGQSIRQVAALLGLGEDAIKKRLERARGVLKASVLERFAGSVTKTAPGAAFTATVAAAVLTSAKDAAAKASLTKAAVGGTPVAPGGLVATLVAAIAGLCAMVAVVVRVVPNEGSQVSHSLGVTSASVVASEGTHAPARATGSDTWTHPPSLYPDPDSDPYRYPRAMRDRERRDELRDRIIAAFDTNPQASLPARGQRDTNDVEEFSRFVTQAIREDFIPMARDCAKDLVRRRPTVHGTAVVAFELLGDTRIGGVVNATDIDRAQSSLADPEFETCVRESLFSVYFDPPPGGGRATLLFPVKIIENADGAIDENVEEFHIKDKR